MPFVQMDSPLRDDVTMSFSGADIRNSIRRHASSSCSEMTQKINCILSSAEVPTKQSQPHEPLTAMNSKSGKGDRYKSELCRQFSENGTCRYGDKCQFAHGIAELRCVARHPKYKTNLCRTFHSTGFCPYGARCHFIHSKMPATNPKLNSGSRAAPSPAVKQSWSPLDSSRITTDQEISCDSLVHDIAEVDRLIRGIQSHLIQEQLLAVSLPQKHFQYSAQSVSPSSENYPSASYPAHLMGSISVSPNLSCSDSPNPSPTSILPDGDIWTSLANIIIGAGV